MLRVCLYVLVCTLALACATATDRDRGWVDRRLTERGWSRRVALTDVLDENAVAALALAHSPSYRAELTRLDAAQADLAEASSLANPQITLLGPLGPISAMATLLLPLESLWQRPARSTAAARALEAVAEALVQSGLDLVRDARFAHVERGLAEDRLCARSALAHTTEELARLGGLRAEAGESDLGEAAALRAEAAIAQDAQTASASALVLARAQLRTVLGLSDSDPDFDIAFRRSHVELPSLPDLLALARSSRPDVRAAELTWRGALARTRWERTRILAVATQLEGHWTQPDTLASRMGARVELPMFQANPGGIGRAEAEARRAAASLIALRQRVLLELIQARTRAVQADTSLTIYRTQVLPQLEDARRVMSRNYELGEQPYNIVLDVIRRQGEARLREVELVADYRRAWAELERAVGARVGTSP